MTARIIEGEQVPGISCLHDWEPVAFHREWLRERAKVALAVVNRFSKICVACGALANFDRRWRIEEYDAAPALNFS